MTAKILCIHLRGNKRHIKSEKRKIYTRPRQIHSSEFIVVFSPFNLLSSGMGP